MNTWQQKIVEEARSWIGTPYHHGADVKSTPDKRGGVDCAMLLVRVYVDVGLVPRFDPRPYPVDFNLHSDDPRYMRFIQQFGVQVEIPEPGDVAMFKYEKQACHGGIIVAEDRMVHAYLQARRVEESEIKNAPILADHLVGYWRMAWPST